ncbi:hypothetical protein Ait01nite_076220 [Actinoplanes italicus]|uniref:Secreted protein n=1 Tax=Actinoplanes italicus TaxID=113567 RepID=A0A2T0JYU7_9ACTN|nr:hypothetical protein [Actinoplanes italicus]PRX14712.1 hypothetical protein CLV67_12398 [Actinoplanes italicus]GIE34577.1 hypothetical protein Ait01nite_076220 [Actinoplanes italicus]
MRRMVKQVLAVASVAVVALGVSIQPAQADVWWTYTRASGSWIQSAGTAKWDNVLDRFYLYDNRADGAGVYGEIEYWSLNGTYMGRSSHYWGGGSGTSTSFSHNYYSGSKVAFRVCLQDNGQVDGLTCSFWKTATG